MARLTVEGRDFVVLTTLENIKKEKAEHSKKIHIIELNFQEPSEEILKEIINSFPETRRYVISNYIKFYNDQFKRYRDKKFYVRNLEGDNLLIFLKRNNKVLLDFTVLNDLEKKLIFEDLRTVLDYIEVVQILKKDFDNHF